MINMHISSEVVLLLWQQLVSWFVTDRCLEKISTFWKQWILQAVHAMVSLTRAEDM